MKMRIKARSSSEAKEGSVVTISGIGKWDGRYVVEKVDPPKSGVENVLLKRVGQSDKG